MAHHSHRMLMVDPKYRSPVEVKPSALNAESFINYVFITEIVSSISKMTVLLHASWRLVISHQIILMTTNEITE